MSIYAKCPTTIAFDKSGHTHVVWCGKWSCARCQKRLARKWAQRARLAHSPSNLSSELGLLFLTLTLGGDVKTATQGFSVIPSLWDITRKQFQRFYGEFSYLAFVEGQPKRGGVPHFHILTWQNPPISPNASGRITKHALHNWAHAIGWGFQAVLEVVTSGQAAEYTAKYATKQSKQTPKHFRRVRCSKDWPKVGHKELSAWVVPRKGEPTVDYLLRVQETCGGELEDISARYVEVQNELYRLREKISS